ncbi:hypothetical protein [Nonomuraea sp. NPDC052265]|uniref:hypothetical protein n=1 Tax=Nonomuraea sp. NPDC052265 TaxID=3364374 RepID=UPI0037C769E0
MNMYKKALTVAIAAAALAGLTSAPASAVVAGNATVFEAATPNIEIFYGSFIRLKEPDSMFECPQDEVLIGRAHYGDETNWTMNQCGRIYIDGERVSVLHENWAWNTRQQESNSYFLGSGNQVIVGRQHLGDENGDTRHKYGTLRWRGSELRLTSRYWTELMKESNHSTQAGPGQVMTGRRHNGDENGLTAYAYGTITVG